MATIWDHDREIFTLLAVVELSGLEITRELAEKVVARWPAVLGDAPVSAEELIRHLDTLKSKPVYGFVPSTPEKQVVAAMPTPPGSCPKDAIVILDDDDLDVLKTPLPVPRLARNAAENIAAAFSVRKTKPMTVITLDDDSDEDNALTGIPALQTPIKETCQLPVKPEHNPFVFTSKNDEQYDSDDDLMPSNNNHLSDSEDEDLSDQLRTIASTRKRRRGIEYCPNTTQICFDNADDDDYIFDDEACDDEKIDQRFESSFPVLTPTKPKRIRAKC